MTTGVLVVDSATNCQGHDGQQSRSADRRKCVGLLFHSDRGSQYASKDFRDLLKDYGITGSMSRKGACLVNACSETLFGSLKGERLHGQRFKTRRDAKDEVVAWLGGYNSRRLHSTLNDISPMQFERNWLAALPKQANS